MTSTAPPRSVLRRLERRMIGALMGIGAFFIEKLVMRSIRRGGGTTKSADATPMQSKGSSIEG